MKVWYSSSSESKPCMLCGKKTTRYKVYEQSNLELRLPLCDDGTETCCYWEVDVKSLVTRQMIYLKKEIIQSGGTGDE
ncbi:hypothetical protein M5X00_31240 [Paenibacillus alvei]|uniref:Uncharacterized protein n=1 Tax=Paenibacillus alvei TaxID=44250 RepID=A0ABT4H7Q9_PAEAL|nr:hypothetical protein [Paenibacillus alvei]EJW14243.1 hypothetical protein PAV_15c00320 [Paenibacillus alvei DSM 29]MCY9704193.1 hypothetical protein [Paenibacillus alvei]MCY9737990.1 hypothetical protein [Paenibacillus alvei]MCY9758696.1 hypothetical protein [Paenibacillus alvei]MCY9765010.1 hypothetical protein [Paenibacillus alvei]